MKRENEAQRRKRILRCLSLCGQSWDLYLGLPDMEVLISHKIFPLALLPVPACQGPPGPGAVLKILRVGF
jgi:hypothetical protein